jgi:hypothetical protein
VWLGACGAWRASHLQSCVFVPLLPLSLFIATSPWSSLRLLAFLLLRSCRSSLPGTVVLTRVARCYILSLFIHMPCLYFFVFFFSGLGTESKLCSVCRAGFVIDI